MKRLILILNISVLSIFIISSCSSEDLVNDLDHTSEGNAGEEVFNYTSPSKHNLNIIYFIPSGSIERVNSHRRLSEILLQGQEFFKQNMVNNGFGEKTFSLLVDQDKKRVKIHYIKGKYSESYYPYEGGGQKIITEIKEYYASNPDRPSSDHYLVITPVEDPKNNNAPYYGLGKFCFATDYDDMDIRFLGGSNNLSTTATTYIGGLLHELGHGLNLPHNKEKVSEHNKSKTALMGSGNYTYGATPTFLTKASCAILNNNQLFNNFSNPFYTGATASVDNIQASYQDNAIKISGTIHTDTEVNYISIYHDPADDNADYDAVSWAEEVTNNTFRLSMPISDFYKKENTPYTLRLKLNHISGDITTLSYFYKFKNGIPIIDFNEKEYISRESWVIEAVSSEESSGQETTGLADAILDGDNNTYWHSCWTGGCSNASHPHTITVNTGKSTVANGFAFVQRQTLSRAIKDIEILISEDNASWQSLGDFELQNVNTTQNITLNNPMSFRYFKIVVKSAHDGDRFAALSEIMCY